MQNREPLRVVIADDSAIYRTVLKKALSQIVGVDLVGSAANGKEALNLIESKRADLLLLDLQMPVMGGMEALDEIKKARIPVGVIIVSGTDVRSGGNTMAALRTGAFDFIVKPKVSRDQDGASLLRDSLSGAIRAYAVSRPRRPNLPTAAAAPPPRPKSTAPVTPANVRPAGRNASKQLKRNVRGATATAYSAVVIGISTGGPAALAQMLPGLSKAFPVPTYIVQHMPPGFTDHLARSLDQDCNVTVFEAEDGQIIQPGEVAIAPGGLHLELFNDHGDVRTLLTKAPPENSCRPAVDVLFRTAAEVYGPRLLSVVMTGMGQDGMLGARDVRNAGGYCIVQEGSTCAVNGMPRSVVEAGEADEIVPLDQLASRIQSLLQLDNRRSA